MRLPRKCIVLFMNGHLYDIIYRWGNHWGMTKVQIGLISNMDMSILLGANTIRDTKVFFKYLNTCEALNLFP